MNYTVKRKIEIEGDNGENLLEVTYEAGYSIWQQLDTIYGPNANPVPALPSGTNETPPQVPQMPPAGGDSISSVEVPPSLKSPSLRLQGTPEQVPTG